MEEIQIKPWMHSCEYFCPHFFKAYRGKGKIANVNARYKNNEAIFTCKDCLQTLKSYMKDTNSMFFCEIRKMLIQYFVPISESNHIMIAQFESYSSNFFRIRKNV